MPSAPRPMTAVEQKGGSRVLASPMAKKLAEAQQLRLEGRGTGLYGSFKTSDLAGMSSGAPAAAAAPSARTQPKPGQAFVDIPLTNIRSVIAKRLLESKVTIPHYYLTVDINMEAVLKMRAKFNKRLEKEVVKLSVNDFIIKATAISNQRVPEANSAWMDTFVRHFRVVDQMSVTLSCDHRLVDGAIGATWLKHFRQLLEDPNSMLL